MAAIALLVSCAHPSDGCDAVQTAIVTTFSQDPGCTSPVGLCTTGTIAYGDLIGTTQFTVAAMGPGPSPDTVLYSGDLVITTATGTITLRDHGLLDSTTAYYIEMQQVASGTGAYAQRTGMLVSQGMATQTGFEGQLNGSICPVH
jgi:hypothetical protein